MFRDSEMAPTMNSCGRSRHLIAHSLCVRLNGFRRPVGGNSRRRPAVEAGILPLNYSRLPYFSSTYLFSKDLGRSTASLFRLLRPSKTMGFDRKMDSKVDSKPVWEASPPPFSFTVHFTVHPTTDSTYHTGPLTGVDAKPDLAAESALTK